MASPEERKKRGAEIVKKYKPSCGQDAYAAANDAITDILLAVASDEDDAGRMLQGAEADYRSTIEGERIAGEG